MDTTSYIATEKNEQLARMNTFCCLTAPSMSPAPTIMITKEQTVPAVMASDVSRSDRIV